MTHQMKHQNNVSKRKVFKSLKRSYGYNCNKWSTGNKYNYVTNEILNVMEGYQKRKHHCASVNWTWFLRMFAHVYASVPYITVNVRYTRITHIVLRLWIKWESLHWEHMDIQISTRWFIHSVFNNRIPILITMFAVQEV